MTATTPALFRRYIGPGEQMLVLAEHKGVMWASNRRWICPAAYLKPFLDKHGIKGPGVWEISGRAVSQRPDRAPDVSGFLDLAAYTVPLENAEIGEDSPGWGIGRSRVYIEDDTGNMGEVFTTPEGNHVAIRADWLDWLERAPAPERQWGEPVMEVTLAATEASRNRGRHGGPVALILRPIAPEDGEDDRARILAIIMPFGHYTPEASEIEDDGAAA